jgi:hypothetical protein
MKDTSAAPETRTGDIQTRCQARRGFLSLQVPDEPVTPRRTILVHDRVHEPAVRAIDLHGHKWGMESGKRPLSRPSR